MLGKLARHPSTIRPGNLATALLPRGAIHNSGTAAFGDLFDGWPEAPTWITTVDLADGHRVTFGREAAGPIGDAVAASCAIPGYFEPVRINGREYIDGGMWSTHNLDLVADLAGPAGLIDPAGPADPRSPALEPLDLVIVSAPMSTTDLAAADLGNLARIPIRLRLDHDVKLVCRTGTRVLVVAPDHDLRKVLGTHSMRISQRRPVAEATYAHVRRLIADGHVTGLG